MDLTKLNNEFAEIQKKIQDYDLIKNRINQNIKRLEKEIIKYKEKTKNEKSKMSKAYYNIVITTDEQNIELLKSLIEEKQEVSK
jgi:CII-binding regulator of phage lambda lysogenization HflD